MISVTPRERGEVKFGPSGGSLWFRAIVDDPANEGVAEVREAVALEAEPTHNGFSLTGIEATRLLGVGPKHLYLCEARYGAGAGFVALPSNTLASYNIALATETMNRSFGVVASGGSGGSDAPDHDQLIRVNGEGRAEGTQVLRPVFTVGWTKDFSQQEVDQAYLGAWIQAVGTVNAQPWKNFPAGTVLFQGLAVEQQTTGRYNARLEFGYRRNQTNFQIGDGMSATIAGWDFLDIAPELDFDTTNQYVIAKPSYFYVHRVYEFVAWGDLGV